MLRHSSQLRVRPDNGAPPSAERRPVLLYSHLKGCGMNLYIDQIRIDYSKAISAVATK